MHGAWVSIAGPKPSTLSVPRPSPWVKVRALAPRIPAPKWAKSFCCLSFAESEGSLKKTKSLMILHGRTAYDAGHGPRMLMTRPAFLASKGCSDFWNSMVSALHMPGVPRPKNALSSSSDDFAMFVPMSKVVSSNVCADIRHRKLSCQRNSDPDC